MKILVTGGCGFIGSHIVDKLIDKNYETIVIDNLSTGKKERLNQKARLIVADITNGTEMQRVFEKEKPGMVIHTAAQVMLRKSIEEPVFDAMTNIIGTINVLEECKKSKVKKIIYTSTGGARYGNPEYLPVNENHKINPSSPYGISKHSAEHYVKAYSDLYGFDYLIFCFGNVYGPRDDPKCKRVTAIFSEQMINGEQPVIYGDGNQTRDFLYVLDLAEFIVNSIEKKPLHKLFNLANGEQVSVNYIFEELKKISNYNGEAKHVDSIKGEVRDIVLDTKLAQKELEWKPKTSMEKGLRETFEWLKNNNQK
ncbi:MAG: NAD-dependent epimerase/dehydratase family protein [archaeon]